MGHSVTGVVVVSAGVARVNRVGGEVDGRVAGVVAGGGSRSGSPGGSRGGGCTLQRREARGATCVAGDPPIRKTDTGSWVGGML